MQRVTFLISLTVLLAVTLACTLPRPEAGPADEKAAAAPPAKEEAKEPVPAGHPEIDEELMLTPCSQCHRTTTPEVYTQWFESTHGIANVKCYQCHGTYENFRKVPEIATCAVCHTGHLRTQTAERNCWECHPAHRFRGHHAKKGGGR